MIFELQNYELFFKFATMKRVYISLIFLLWLSTAVAVILKRPANGKTMFVNVTADGEERVVGWTDFPLAATAELPPALAGWLDNIVESEPADAQSSPHGDAIPPLLTTEWNQTDPYNRFCPLIGSTHAPVGCAATAMAMVVHHNRVFDGKGSVTIHDSDGSAKDIDLAELKFDFDGMPLNSSNTSGWDDVAMLSAICGSTINMQYALSGSGAYLYDIPSALSGNMGYDPATTFHLYRKAYTIDEWDKILYNELANGRPVIYAGGSPGGHAFVCDGYAPGNFYHINWGWGGLANGYFALTSLTPTGTGPGSSLSNNYTAAQECVLARPFGAPGALLHLKVSGYCAIAGSDRMKAMFNVAGAPGVYEIATGYIIENILSPGITVKENRCGTVECRSGATAAAGTTVSLAQVADALPVGEYLVFPAFADGDSRELRKADQPRGNYQLGLSVDAGGTAHFSEIQSQARICIEETEVVGRVYRTSAPVVRFRITNTGSKDAYASLCVAIAGESGSILRQRTIDGIEVAAGHSELFETTVPNYQVGDGYLTPGKYIVTVGGTTGCELADVSPASFEVIDAADPSAMLNVNNPDITVSRADDEPEIIMPPYSWQHDVEITCRRAQSATVGLAFYRPGEYDIVGKFTMPYQRWETASRSRITLSLGDISLPPGDYEMAYVMGNMEISTRKFVRVAAECDGFYYLTDPSSFTATMCAAPSRHVRHMTIPRNMTSNGNDYCVTGVGRDAFAACGYLTSVAIPASVVSVQGDAFRGASLSAVVFDGNPPFRNYEGVFGNLELRPDIYVPKDHYYAFRDIVGGNAQLYTTIAALCFKSGRLEFNPGTNKFTLEVLPHSTMYNRTFTASSDNPEVASVEIEGFSDESLSLACTAIKPGMAVITVESAQPGLETVSALIEVTRPQSGIDAATDCTLPKIGYTDGVLTIENAAGECPVSVCDLNGAIIAQTVTNPDGTGRVAIPTRRKGLTVIVAVGDFRRSVMLSKR